MFISVMLTKKHTSFVERLCAYEFSRKKVHSRAKISTESAIYDGRVVCEN